MPGADRVPLLEAEVLVLKHLVHELQERVSVLEAQTEFEVVGESRSEPPPLSSSAVQLPVQVPQSGSQPSDLERIRILQRIGKWIKQALSGNRIGTSGRELLKEPSAFYLVASDFAGRDCKPASVFTDWASTSRIVKPRGQFGQSLCIGLPSREDCEVVAVWAGLELPAHFGHGASY